MQCSLVFGAKLRKLCLTLRSFFLSVFEKTLCFSYVPSGVLYFSIFLPFLFAQVRFFSFSSWLSPLQKKFRVYFERNITCCNLSFHFVCEVMFAFGRKRCFQCWEQVHRLLWFIRRFGRISFGNDFFFPLWLKIEELLQILEMAQDFLLNLLILTNSFIQIRTFEKYPKIILHFLKN